MTASCLGTVQIKMKPTIKKAPAIWQEALDAIEAGPVAGGVDCDDGYDGNEEGDSYSP